MLKPEQLKAMTPEQRTDLFQRLCAAYYSDRLTGPTVAADFDVNRETYFRWIKNHNVPWAVLFTLDRWLNSEVRTETIVQNWGSVAEDLAGTATQLSRLAGTLARLAKLSQPVSLDTDPA